MPTNRSKCQVTPPQTNARKRVLLLSMLSLALVLPACTMIGPDYVKPDAAVSDAWMEMEDTRLKIEEMDYRDWWAVFNDPILNGLVQMAYEQNLTLQIAGLRVAQARAQLGIAVGNLYPQQQQSAGAATRVSSSENAANTLGGDLSFWQYEVGFDAVWELDFWGKFRRGVQSATADYESSIADYDDFLVTLISEVARVYVQMRTFEERLAIAYENVKIQERSLNIANARFKGGAVTELDVQQALSLLRNTEATIPGFEAGMRQSKNALAVLLGILPHEVDLLIREPGPIPTVPVEVAVGIPAELMRRRPDIRLAEYQMVSQCARIGVAKGDLFPHLELFGSIGWLTSNGRNTKAGGERGSGFNDLFDQKSFEIFAGPSFRWDLFNYGRLKNQVRVQDALFQQLIVNYQDTVIRAQQEVEDALVGLLRTQEQDIFLADSVKAAKRSVELSLVQYREGLVDFQRVLDSQRNLSDQQDLETETRGSVVLNLIAMYKALGGGWQIREGKEFITADTVQEMRQRTNWGKLLSPSELDLPPEEKQTNWRRPDW